MCDLASKLIDAQADDTMESLELHFLSAYLDTLEPEDKLLIDSIINSGQTNLSSLKLGFNDGWWADTEASALLADYIRD